MRLFLLVAENRVSIKNELTDGRWCIWHCNAFMCSVWHYKVFVRSWRHRELVTWQRDVYIAMYMACGCMYDTRLMRWNCNSPIVYCYNSHNTHTTAHSKYYRATMEISSNILYYNWTVLPWLMDKTDYLGNHEFTDI